VSIPKPSYRKPSATEVAATWQLIFTAVREELAAKGLEETRATEIAAYVAATLVRESKHGNESRNN